MTADSVTEKEDWYTEGVTGDERSSERLSARVKRGGSRERSEETQRGQVGSTIMSREYPIRE